jgi:predicted glutamine amidotransferase
MCRLYGFRATEPTKVECTLVLAQNALLSQSIADRRGEAHPDGWGISCHEDSELRVERRDTAAHADEHFSLAAERIYAETVVAHVRKATVGGHSLANTHPFTYGPWAFAHNGTLRGFAELEQSLLAETAPDLRARRTGDTDSEAAFLWLLTRLREVTGEEIPRPDEDTLAEVVGEAVRVLDGRSRALSPEPPSRLNFLVTDGRLLVASRLRNTLFWVWRDGVHDCEICGIPHIHHSERRAYRAIVVASEPITHEHWQEVPDSSLLRIGPAVEPVVVPF